MVGDNILGAAARAARAPQLLNDVKSGDAISLTWNRVALLVSIQKARLSIFSSVSGDRLKDTRALCQRTEAAVRTPPRGSSTVSSVLHCLPARSRTQPLQYVVIPCSAAGEQARAAHGCHCGGAAEGVEGRAPIIDGCSDMVLGGAQAAVQKRAEWVLKPVSRVIRKGAMDFYLSKQCCVDGGSEAVMAWAGRGLRAG